MKKFDFSDRFTSITLFCVGMYISLRGFYWTIRQEDVLKDSEFYQALHHWMSIWIWGLIILLFGLCLVFASVFYGKQHVNNISNYLLVVGGFGSSVMHILMGGASLFNAINWVTPIQFAVLAGLFGMYGFLGGTEINGRRKKE